MTLTAQQYERRLRRGMRGVPGRTRRDLVEELVGGYEVKLQAASTDPSVLAAIDDPKRVGRALRAVHGIGWGWRILHWLLAGVLGVLSTPLLEAWLPAYPGTFFLILLTVLVVRAAALGGRWHGLVTGMAGAVPRILMLFAFAAFMDWVAGHLGPTVAVPEESLTAVVITSLLLPVVGFLAGKRLRRPE